jgi:alanine dehydrogenase
LTLLITESDVAKLLTYDDALRSLEEAFNLLEEGQASNTPRTRTYSPVSALSVQAASLRFLSGLKAYVTGKFPPNFVSLLFDGNTGDLLAIVESDRLGQMRTAAVSALAAKLMASDVSTVGIIGVGRQGIAQVEAFWHLLSPKIKIYSRTRDRLLKVREEMSKRGIDTSAAESYREVCESGVIVTVTSSKDPFLKAEWVRPGTHVNLMGSNLPNKAEAFPDLIRNCDIIAVEDLAQAKAEAGDLILAEKLGMMDWRKVVEFSKVTSNRVRVRNNRREITSFKSVGIGLEDVAVLRVVYEKAKKEGLGQEIKVRGLWSPK